MRKRPERILVLGATGHIGQAVVRHALEQKQKVTAATRQADPAALRGLELSVVRVTSALHSLSELAASHDLIVDAAAPYPLDPALPGTEAWRDALQSAETHAARVIGAALECRIPLAFVSSFTTLPRRESTLQAMETSWRRSAYPYFEAKLAMERQVLRAANRGLKAVVVNPSACLGPWDWRPLASSFVGLVLSRRLPLVMDHTVNVIDVRDIAIALENALAAERFGHTIPLAGHNIAVAALAARTSSIAGIPGANPLAIDPRLSAIAAFWTGTAFAAFGSTAPDLVRAVPLMADAFPMSPSSDQLAIGVQIRPLDDTLAAAVSFMRNRVHIV